MPSPKDYSCIILIMDKEYINLRKGCSYFYDNCSINHHLDLISVFKLLLNMDLPYISFMLKNN